MYRLLAFCAALAAPMAALGQTQPETAPEAPAAEPPAESDAATAGAPAVDAPDDSLAPGEPAAPPSTVPPATAPAAAPAAAVEVAPTAPPPPPPGKTTPIADASAPVPTSTTDEGDDEDESEDDDPYSDFIDTRLNFTFTNENVFANLGESQFPNFPGYRFGPPTNLGVLFFENYDTRFSGFETLSHGVLYKGVTRGQWDVEGAMVVRFTSVAEGSIDIEDAGSYIHGTYWLDPERRRKDRVSFTAFPTSSDRFRLGYSFRLSWGGSGLYQRSGVPVPGLKVQYSNDRLWFYGGAKSAVLVDAELDEERAEHGFLFGGGIDITDMVRFELNGGYFDRGSSQLEDLVSENVQLAGLSAQLSVHKDMPLTSSIDFRLYKNDPERAVRFFRPEKYPGGLSWLVAAEATVIGQTLKDLDKGPGSTTVQYGAAGDINFRAKYNYTRFMATTQYRDLAFILHRTPSLPAFSDFADEFEIAPNFFFAGGFDHHFPESRVTAGVTLGFDIPATLEAPASLPGDTAEASGEATYVIRSEGEITRLPVGEGVLPEFAAKFTGRWDFADPFAFILDVYFSRDPNRTRLVRDGPDDLLRPEFDEDNFNRLGFNVNLQARF